MAHVSTNARSRKRRTALGAAPGCRPLLEALEDRTLPALITWGNPGGGSWDDRFNWLDGVVPGINDQASIPQAGITVTHDDPVNDAVQSLDSRATVEVSAGSLTLAQDSQIDTLNLNGGTLTEAGNLVLNTLAWAGGTLNGSGQVIATTVLSITGPNAKTLDGLTLSNVGQATWDGADVATVNGSSFDNMAGATFTATADATFDTTFANAGTFQVNGANPTLTEFDNSGTVLIQGGSLTAETYSQEAGSTAVSDPGDELIVPGSLTWAAGTLSGAGQVQALGSLAITSSDAKELDGLTVNNAGQAAWDGIGVTTANGATFNNLPSGIFLATADAGFAPTFNNEGEFEEAASGGETFTTFQNSGSVTLTSGTLTADTYGQTDGTTLLQGHVLASPNPIELTGGELLGPGTINGDLDNAAVLGPGGPGVLYLNGNYTQTSAGTLQVGLGGTIPGIGIDQLVVSGRAALDGTLAVQSLNGFVPVAGDGFRVLAFAAVTGDFSDKTGLDLTPAVHLSPVYHPGDLTLEVPTAPQGGNRNPGGSVQPPSAPNPPPPGPAPLSPPAPHPPPPAPVVPPPPQEQQAPPPPPSRPKLSTEDRSTLAILPNPNAPPGPRAGVPEEPLPAPPPAPLAPAAGEGVDPGSAPVGAMFMGQVQRNLPAGFGEGSPPAPAGRVAQPPPLADRGMMSLSPQGRMASGMGEGGAEDLLEDVALVPTDLELPPEKERTTTADLAGTLLTGARPRADILPQKGSSLASVATLLSGEAGEEGAAKAHDVPREEALPLLLISPVPPAPVAGPNRSRARGTGGPRASGSSGFTRWLLFGAGLLGIRAARGAERSQDRRPGFNG